jgi:glutamate--cysteine ligase
MRLLRDGREVTLKSWASEIINEMFGMCEVVGFDEFDTLTLMLGRVSNPDLTYGKRLLKIIEEEGYINAHRDLSKNNKKTSINNLKKIDSKEYERVKKYADIALVKN